MTLTTKKVATAKKVARPRVKPPTPDPDPVGFAQVLAETSAKLDEAYQERLCALLRKFLLIRFEPAVSNAASTREQRRNTSPPRSPSIPCCRR